MRLHVIARRHGPARTMAGVGKLGLAIAVVIMVAQDHVPGDLERRRGINIFERFLPVIISQRSHPVLVEIVAHGNNKSGRRRFWAAKAHLFRDFPLVQFTPASPIAEHQKIQCFCAKRFAKRFTGKNRLATAAWLATDNVPTKLRRVLFLIHSGFFQSSNPRPIKNGVVTEK